MGRDSSLCLRSNVVSPDALRNRIPAASVSVPITAQKLVNPTRVGVESVYATLSISQRHFASVFTVSNPDPSRRSHPLYPTMTRLTPPARRRMFRFDQNVIFVRTHARTTDGLISPQTSNVERVGVETSHTVSQSLASVDPRNARANSRFSRLRDICERLCSAHPPYSLCTRHTGADICRIR